MKRLFVLAVIVWCGAALASGEEAPELGDLGWMSGHWVGQSGDVGMEEFWTTPEGEVNGVLKTTEWTWDLAE